MVSVWMPNHLRLNLRSPPFWKKLIFYWKVKFFWKSPKNEIFAPKDHFFWVFAMWLDYLTGTASNYYFLMHFWWYYIVFLWSGLQFWPKSEILSLLTWFTLKPKFCLKYLFHALSYINNWRGWQYVNFETLERSQLQNQSIWWLSELLGTN